MNDTVFAKILKRLRMERGISQMQLADQLFVTRSTINRWESGSRIPDNLMIVQISKALDVDINILLNATIDRDESPNIILVDDSKIILKGCLPILEEALPEPGSTASPDLPRPLHVQRQTGSHWHFWTSRSGR